MRRVGKYNLRRDEENSLWPSLAQTAALLERVCGYLRLNRYQINKRVYPLSGGAVYRLGVTRRMSGKAAFKLLMMVLEEAEKRDIPRESISTYGVITEPVERTFIETGSAVGANKNGQHEGGNALTH